MQMAKATIAAAIQRAIRDSGEPRVFLRIPASMGKSEALPSLIRGAHARGFGCPQPTAAMPVQRPARTAQRMAFA